MDSSGSTALDRILTAKDLMANHSMLLWPMIANA